MTHQQIEDIKNSLKLPKDELDGFYDNLSGFWPAGMFLIASSYAFFAGLTEGHVSIKFELVFFFFSLVLFLYTVAAKLKERNLKTISTGLSQLKNLEIIEQIALEQTWSTKADKGIYKEYLIPLVVGAPGHKLTLIITDNEILFNLRNIGSTRGRMPYLFGIDTIKEFRLRKQIKMQITLADKNAAL